MNSIPLYKYTSLSILPLMGTWAVSKALLLLSCNKHSCTRLLVGMFSFFLDKYLEMELLDNMNMTDV